MQYIHNGIKWNIPDELIEQQDLRPSELRQIIALQKERTDLFNLLIRAKDRTFMRIIYHQITEINYELQMLWGFELNDIRHKSFTYPHCICPKMDNEDMYPYFMIIDLECPLHGK